jgi:hypothetical protein
MRFTSDKDGGLQVPDPSEVSLHRPACAIALHRTSSHRSLTLVPATSQRHCNAVGIRKLLRGVP